MNHTHSYRPNPGRLFTVFAALLIAHLFVSVGCLNSGSSRTLGDGHDFGENDSQRVLVLGDSITRGGFSGAAPWPARFGNMVGKTVINDGLAGAPAGAGAARIRRQINRHKPGYVIIIYGANDAIQGAPIANTENAIRHMVAVAKDSQCIPVLANVMPMEGPRRIYNGRVNQINQRIRSVADQADVTIVNLHRAIRRNPDRYLVDGLHLSDTGEELVALEFLDAFHQQPPEIKPPMRM